MFVCCECYVLSGRGLCDELITRPEESYQLWCVVVCDQETSKVRRPWPALGHRKQTNKRCHLHDLKMYCLSNTFICELCTYYAVPLMWQNNGKLKFTLCLILVPYNENIERKEVQLHAFSPLVLRCKGLVNSTLKATAFKIWGTAYKSYRIIFVQCRNIPYYLMII